MIIDIYRMVPEAVRRVEVLEELKRCWPNIVGAAVAKYSQPYCLGVNELWVCAKNVQAKSFLMKAKGNIARAMVKRFGYKTSETFKLIITDDIPAPKKLTKKPAPRRAVKVDEETVRQYMQGAPDTLPEDINYAISHLRAFLEK